MKLTDLMKSHGWEMYPMQKSYGQLKVYKKGSLLFGVQKIGNVFRMDIQQVMDLGGMCIPMDKVLDKHVVPLDQLEPTLNDLLPQLI